ncbi:DNA mismatch repair protein MutS [Cucumispora dikerogammari]|nr:DNA mismatch repair protein MutS [Cucumispora dikerogammari]
MNETQNIKKIPQFILHSQIGALHINKLSSIFSFQLPSTITEFNLLFNRKMCLPEILEKQRITTFFKLNPCNLSLFNVEKINEMDFKKVNIAMSKFLEKVLKNQSKTIDINSLDLDFKIEESVVKKFKNKLLKLKDNIINIQELKNTLTYKIEDFTLNYHCDHKHCTGQTEFKNIRKSMLENTKYLGTDFHDLKKILDRFFDDNDEIISNMPFHKHLASLMSNVSDDLETEISGVLNFNPKIKRVEDNFKILKSLIKHIEKLNPIMLGANNQGAFFTTVAIKKLLAKKNQVAEVLKGFEWYEMGKIYKLLKPYMLDLECIGRTVNLLDMHQAYAVSNLKNSIFIENSADLCDSCKRIGLVINDEKVKDLKFIGFEHPLIPDCVKNNFFFDNNFVKLTGPNTSGKSTILRSIALIIYLSHIGAPSCVETSFIKYFECIRIRIGSADKEGQSTFMVEMLELSEIIETIKTVKGNLLILIDELGRGTSINDGLAICKGVMQFLKSQANVFCIFVTHFQELEEGIPAQERDETWSLKNYRLVKGGNLSFGIECAKECGFPEDVIASAYKYYFDDKPL